MSMLETMLRLQQERNQGTSNDINNGLSIAADTINRQDAIKRQDAEKNRVLSDPMQRLMKAVIEGRASGKSAATAAKMIKTGMLPDDFDFDGDGIPDNQQSRVPASPGIGPENMTQPPVGQAAAFNMPQPMSAVSPDHKYTAQDLNDLHGMSGLMGRPGADTAEDKFARLALTLAEKQKDRDLKASEGQANRETKSADQDKRFEFFGKKLEATRQEAEKNRVNALRIAELHANSRELISLRNSQDKVDQKLLDNMNRLVGVMTSAATRISTSLNAANEDPSALRMLGSAEAELEKAKAEYAALYAKLKTRAAEAQKPKGPTADEIMQKHFSNNKP